MNRNKATAAYHLVYVNKYAEDSVGIGGLHTETSVQPFKIQARVQCVFMVLCNRMEF
jgi:hypothetical protein